MKSILSVKTINIQGNEYVPVDERVRIGHENGLKSITTEMISDSPALFKATVTTDKGTFTGHSAANPSKAIEKASPYEVAETSAIGRALGFAGYGLVNGIATPEEINKVDINKPKPTQDTTLAGEFRLEKCAYDGKTSSIRNQEYGFYQWGLLKPLCFECQQIPERRELAMTEQGREELKEIEKDMDIEINMMGEPRIRVKQNYPND